MTSHVIVSVILVLINVLTVVLCSTTTTSPSTTSATSMSSVTLSTGTTTGTSGTTLSTTTQSTTTASSQATTSGTTVSTTSGPGTGTTASTTTGTTQSTSTTSGTSGSSLSTTSGTTQQTTSGTTASRLATSGTSASTLTTQSSTLTSGTSRSTQSTTMGTTQLATSGTTLSRLVTSGTSASFQSTASGTTQGHDFCSPSPCKNGGTCIPLIGDYNCSCPDGYTSKSCEVVINKCEPQPCYPSGYCQASINRYQCFCLPGFISYNGSCQEIDECANANASTCSHRGTCKNLINEYYCQCDQPGNGTTVYGQNCEKSNSTQDIPVPTFSGISRSTGIEAGGTAVTFTGQGFDILRPIGAYFRNDQPGELFGYVLNETIQPTSFVLLTPKANSTNVGQPFLITVLLSGGIQVKLQQTTFTYVNNPAIYDLNPKVQNINGSVILTVNGSYLNIVANPQMIVTLIKRNQSNNYPEIGRTYYQTCYNATYFSMKCKMPNFTEFNFPNASEVYPINRRKRSDASSGFIPSPTDLSKILHRFFHQKSSADEADVSSRMDQVGDRQPRKLLLRKRRDNQNTYINLTQENYPRFEDLEPTSTFRVGQNRDHFYELYINFTLDNYPGYQNFAGVLPNVTREIKLVNYRPVFSATDNKKQQSYDPSADGKLFIQGENLTSGVSLDDYSVSVGPAKCAILKLTDNALTFSPPQEKPDTTNYTEVYCKEYDQYLAVLVTIADVQNFVFCFNYPIDQTFLIVGLCVGLGGGFLLVLAIIISIIVQRKRKRQRKKNPYFVADHPRGRHRLNARPHGQNQAGDNIPIEDYRTDPDARDYDRDLDEFGGDGVVYRNAGNYNRRFSGAGSIDGGRNQPAYPYRYPPPVNHDDIDIRRGNASSYFPPDYDD